METKREKKISKSLSYWLRHHPEAIDLTLSEDGWVDVDVLIENSSKQVTFTFDELKYVVKNNDKRRFSFNEDLTKIRANQGHSVKVEMNFEEVKPPTIIYHGTSKRFLKPILREGLKPMSRHHVHLSKDEKTAKIVASRRGGPIVILEIEAMRMRADGYKFYISDNEVYLTDIVPPKYINIIEE